MELPEKMEAYYPKQCKRCCERKPNFITEWKLCLEAADRFRMNNYTSNHPPSAFLTPTQEKIALLELNVLPAGSKLPVPGSDHQDFTTDFLLYCFCLRFGQHPNKFQ